MALYLEQAELRIPGSDYADSDVKPDPVHTHIANLLDTMEIAVPDARVRGCLCDQNEIMSVGFDADWADGRWNVLNLVIRRGINAAEEAGVAALDGLKVAVVVMDCIGRVWMLGTVGLEYVLPKRL